MLTLKQEWKMLSKVRGRGGKTQLKCGRKRLSGVHRLVRLCTPGVVLRNKHRRKHDGRCGRKKNLFLLRYKRRRLRNTSVSSRPRPPDFILIKGTHFLFMRGNAIIVDQQIGHFVNQARTNFAWKCGPDGRWDLCRRRNGKKEQAHKSFDLSRKLWDRWYEYNAHTLSATQLARLKHCADSAWGLRPHSPSNPHQWPLQVHPMVWTLLTFFWNKGLRPVAAQVPVACFFTKEEARASGGQTNLGTFVDLLMYEPPPANSQDSGTLWTLELKKMQSGPTPQNLQTRHEKRERHQGVLDFIPIDGDYGTASAQALFGEILLRHNYQLPSKGLKIKSAVLRVCSSGVGFQEVPRSWSRQLHLRLASLRNP